MLLVTMCGPRVMPAQPQVLAGCNGKCKTARCCCRRADETHPAPPSPLLSPFIMKQKTNLHHLLLYTAVYYHYCYVAVTMHLRGAS